MIDKKTIYPILLASAAIAMPLSSSAAPEVTPQEAKEILGDTITYGQQMLEAAMDNTVAREAYMGAQSSVDAKEIERWKGVYLKDAIRGKLAGWYNGKIRGASTPNETSLLIVLDGVPAPLLDIEYIDPSTVENVTILKDAAAKALYGPMAAQGAMLITTKHGNEKGVKVNVSANIGIQKPTELHDMFGSYDQALLRNQALINDGVGAKFSAAELAAFQNGEGINNNWIDKYFKDTFFQKYNVEMRGGGEKVRFYINGGFSREQGQYKTDWHEKYDPQHYVNRFTIVSNLDVDVFSFLRAFTNINTDIKRINDSREVASILPAMFTTPSYIDDGYEDGHVLTSSGYDKPLYGMINYSGINRMVQTNLTANIGLDLDMAFLTKGLSAKAIFGYYTNYNGIRGGAYDYFRGIRNDDGSISTYGSNAETALSWSKGVSSLYYLSFQGMINYNRTFGRHAVTANLNYNAEDYRGNWTTAGWILPSSRIQLAGQFKYGYDNRYFAEFIFNHAGSEMMAEGHRFHFSPTAALSWVASNESFLKDNPVVTFLKFRGSYGRLTYDTLCRPYVSATEGLPSRYLYKNDIIESVGFIQTLFANYRVAESLWGNPNIGWETSYQQNYGFDLGLMDDLHITFDYWRTKQKDILLQSELIPTLGGISQNNRPYSNLGEATSQGIDLSVSYGTVLPCGLEIEARGQMGWNKNTYDDAAELSYASANYAYPYRKTGYSFGEKFGYKVDRTGGSPFYNSQAEIDNSGLTFSGVQPKPGDLKYQDLNGDKVIDEGDLAPLGVTSTPNFDYGASVNLAYKGFDLYIELYGVAGRDYCYQGQIGVSENTGTEGVYMPIHKHAWTPERFANGEKISYPRLTSSASYSQQANDFFTSKADFLRLRNVTLGYSLPDKLIRPLHISKIRFYVSGQNLLTWDNCKFDGFDPESRAITSLVYRSFNFGINVNF